MEYVRHSSYSTDQAKQICVIGGSSGSMQALLTILDEIHHAFSIPILFVSHLCKEDDGDLVRYLSKHLRFPVREAEDKLAIAAGTLYTGPANYHLMIESNAELALSIDAKVNWARPSIDVLFESAARAFGASTMAVLLSGANQDGAAGMELIQRRGGLCIVQDPASAECEVMPAAAIRRLESSLVLSPVAIGQMLNDMFGKAATENTDG